MHVESNTLESSAIRSSFGSELFTTARLFLTAAQHTFDTLRPLVAQLPAVPRLCAPCDLALHEELEYHVARGGRAAVGAGYMVYD